MRHGVQPGEALTPSAAEHTDPAKGKAPFRPAACPAATQGLWPTECYERTEESKRRGCRDQMLSPALPIPYWVALGLLPYLSWLFFFFPVGKNEAGGTNFLAGSFGQSCSCISRVFSSWMPRLHTWFLWLLSTSGLPSLVLFPLHPGKSQASATQRQQLAQIMQLLRALAYFILSIWRQRLCLPAELLQYPLRCLEENLYISCFCTLPDTKTKREEQIPGRKGTSWAKT